MEQKTNIKLFDERQVRVVWDEEKEKYFFSVVDVIEVLTDSDNPTDYLKKMRKRDPELGSYIGTNCPQVLMETSTGKKRLTLAADTEQVLRIIQSVPSKKAEPLKRWLAEVGSQRLNQMQDPELGIEQAVNDYRRLGYSEAWINQRIRSIEVRKELTDEWKRGGVEEGAQFASLTDILTKAWSGRTTKQYKQLKGLRKESLRDNMTNVELALNTLAEASAAELSKQRNPKGFKENARVAGEGGDVAKVARQQLEQSLGRPVVTGQKASDYIHPIEDTEAKVLGDHRNKTKKDRKSKQ